MSVLAWLMVFEFWADGSRRGTQDPLTFVTTIRAPAAHELHAYQLPDLLRPAQQDRPDLAGGAHARPPAPAPVRPIDRHDGQRALALRGLTQPVRHARVLKPLMGVDRRTTDVLVAPPRSRSGGGVGACPAGRGGATLRPAR